MQLSRDHLAGRPWSCLRSRTLTTRIWLDLPALMRRSANQCVRQDASEPRCEREATHELDEELLSCDAGPEHGQHRCRPTIIVVLSHPSLTYIVSSTPFRHQIKQMYQIQFMKLSTISVKPDINLYRETHANFEPMTRSGTLSSGTAIAVCSLRPMLLPKLARSSR